MRILEPIAIALVTLSLGVPARAQDAPGTSATQPIAPETTQGLTVDQGEPAASPAAAMTPSAAIRMMQGFKDSDVKFDVNELVDILRDRRHEGWVLAAYPDPRTSQPLIGAGFSLDLPERPHPQPDTLNPHPFLEPSSADLWQAAGFDPGRLDEILSVFYQRRRNWTKRTWRRQLYSLPPQISDDEAIELVRVGAIQAIYNAKAYCRNFDQMTGPQQMAMAQLVYQMGVNLQHFNAFLTMINPDPGPAPQTPATDSAMFGQAVTEAAAAAPAGLDQSPEYWLDVQKSLMGSQWAHKYRTRAVAVIAMLDPSYGDDPAGAEQRVGAVLRPAVAHRSHGHGAMTRQVAATTHHGSGSGRKAHHTAARSRNKKRA